MSTLFQAPSFKAMFPVEKRRAKLLREYLRYQLKTLCFARSIKQFTQFLNENPHWIPLFQKVLYRFNSLLTKYCDNRWNAKQRQQAISQNLQLAEQNFGKNLCSNLLQELRLPLSQLTDELSLQLNINQIDPYEGFFSLNIQSEKGSIYDASFTFIAPNALLIASIQGPNHNNAQEVVRDATKQLHGLRPMFMLTNAFKLLSQQLNCELLGIPHKNQAKYRWNDKSKLLFNYDEFWQENGATLNQTGYWQLPLELDLKPLSDIQSKKRAMYRRRYEMLEQLQQDLSQFFK